MKLEVPEKLLTDFVTAVTKVFSKPKHVCITGIDNRVIFFVAQDAQQVAFSIESPTEDFGVAVEATRFLAAAKQIYSEHAVVNFVRSAKKSEANKIKDVVVEYGDVVVKLPVQVPQRVWYQQDYSAFDIPPGFLEGLTHTMFVPDTDPRFSGTLIDQLEDGSVIARFSGSALAFTKISTAFAARFAIFKDFAKLAKTKTKYEHILVSDRGFGLRSANGVQTTCALMEDSYPQGYLPGFGLATSGPLVDPRAFDLCYEFDAQELKDGVKLVSAVVGDDEQSIVFALEGREQGTQTLVWRLSSKSYKGLKAEELVRASGKLTAKPQAFKLHKKTLLKALDDYTGSMYVIDNGNAVLLSDASGNSVVVLTKLGSTTHSQS